MANTRGVRVGRGATYLFLSSITTIAVGLVYFLVIYRTVTKEETGIYALLSIVLSLVQILSLFSLPSASVKYVSQYLAEGNREKARSVVSRVLQLALVASAASLVLVFISAGWLSTTISGTASNIMLFRLFSVTGFFVILYFQAAGLLQGMQKIGMLALISGAYLVLQSVTGIYLVLSGWGLVGVVSSWLVAYAFGFFASLIIILKNLGVSRKLYPIRPLFRFSYPLYVSSIIGFLASYVDSILLVSLMSAAHGLTEAQQLLGIYNVAVRASAVPNILSSAIIGALFPQLSELYSQEGIKGLRDAAKAATRYSVLVGFPVIIGIALLASPIVILFGGWEYRAAGLPLTILSLAGIPVAVSVALSSVLLTLERTKAVSIITIISVLSTSVVSSINLAYLYPSLGLTGTDLLTGPAIARTIAAVIAFVLSVYALKRVLSFSFDKESLWKASASSLSMIAAILVLDVARQMLTAPPHEFLVFSLRLLPVYIVVGGGAYFLALSRLKAIKKKDLELFQQYLPSGFRRVIPLLERLARVD